MLVRRLLLLFALVYAGLCAALFATQDSLIYFPTPAAPGASENTLRLAVDGAELQVSVRSHAGPNALIYFGGNAEDVSRSLPSFSAAFPDHALYLLHYRGYGGSSGRPSERAIHADAIALFDHVSADHPNVSVLGRSLGSGVAVRLASQRPVRRLLLITPYDSLVGVAAGHYPLLPVHWLMRDKYESVEHAANIAVPTLIVAAEHDEVISRASTDRLLARFERGVAALVVLPGTGHNSISNSRLYLETLRAGLGEPSSTPRDD